MKLNGNEVCDKIFSASHHERFLNFQGGRKGPGIMSFNFKNRDETYIVFERDARLDFLLYLLSSDEPSGKHLKTEILKVSFRMG